ncbi:hypothetical protein K493DRAFT_408768 [Basidiobolus meristosporus CBS 931.73]|uniref:Uncharacterized protein n=1 Tax=Basidiobolus meristosporus CBS 931.73 TaxID=1314790 RepID=A0A1Y1Y3J9_9FUNG|nr:hypothetical protein K493DRAFT_408768 [Basidiobolus meristosporus CBS 931.73]|eukprot:ORX92601.1 hypothetical protein K493DRAFT_408768 [Basidiobolus meristosporus CBS 931.73]
MDPRYKLKKAFTHPASHSNNRILSGVEMVSSLREMDARYQVNFSNWVADEKNVINIGAKFGQMASEEYSVQQIGNAMLLVSKNWSDAARQYLFYTTTADWSESRREALYWYLVTPRNPKHVLTAKDFTPQNPSILYTSDGRYQTNRS